MDNKTIWEDIFKHLSNNGFDVYSPGTKKGEAQSKYIVLKNDGGSTFLIYSSDVIYYSVLCYVPVNEYSGLEEYIMRVKETLRELYPKIKHTGYESPSFYDDFVKAHMVSLQYRNYRRKL